MAALFRPYTAAALMAIALGLVTLAAAHAADGRDPLRKINHIVVIYQENHSFDNLYGGWEGVDGLANAHALQVDQKGAALEEPNSVKFAIVQLGNCNTASLAPLSCAAGHHRGEQRHQRQPRQL